MPENLSVQELIEILLFVVTNVKYPFVNEAKLWNFFSDQRLSIFTEFKWDLYRFDMSSPSNPNPDPSPEEEEIARLAAFAALNKSTISMSNSLFPAFPSTMQLQGEVFIVRHNFIDEAYGSTNRLRGTPRWS